MALSRKRVPSPFPSITKRMRHFFDCRLDHDRVGLGAFSNSSNIALVLSLPKREHWGDAHVPPDDTKGWTWNPATWTATGPMKIGCRRRQGP